MKSSLLLLLLCATAALSARIEVGDRASEGLFYVELDSDGGVTWRQDDGTPGLTMVEYSTLSSIGCTADGYTPVRRADGTWRCVLVDRLESVCSATLDDDANLVAKTDGLGGWRCGADAFDAADCADASHVLKFSSSASPRWQCAADGDLALSLACSDAMPYYVYERGVGWACAASLPADADTAAALLATCAAGEVIKAASGGGFECDDDNDTLGSLACAAGQVAKNVSSAAACADDDDEFGEFTCPGSHPWPKYNPAASGAPADYWVCSDTYRAGGTTSTGVDLGASKKRDVSSKRAVGVANTMLLWGAVSANDIAAASGDALTVRYAGQSRAPWVMSAGGRVVALSVRVELSSDDESAVASNAAVIELSLLVNGVAQVTETISRPASAGEGAWYTTWFDGANLTTTEFAATDAIGVALTASTALQHTPAIDVQVYVSADSIVDTSATYDCVDNVGDFAILDGGSTIVTSDSTMAACQASCDSNMLCSGYFFLTTSVGVCTHVQASPTTMPSGVSGFRSGARGLFDGPWLLHTGVRYFALNSADSMMMRATDSAERQWRECANLAESIDASAFFTDFSAGRECYLWTFATGNGSLCLNRHALDQRKKK